MNKKLDDIRRRHAAIKTVIASQNIANQRELAQALRSLKIRVTQATLSRDLSELGVARAPFEGGHRYEIRMDSGVQTLRAHIAEEILSVNANECVIVIKTFPGRASGVAVLLDNQQDPELLGTVAGDDTVIVVPQTTRHIHRLIQQIKYYTGME